MPAGHLHRRLMGATSLGFYDTLASLADAIFAFWPMTDAGPYASSYPGGGEAVELSGTITNNRAFQNPAIKLGSPISYQSGFTAGTGSPCIETDPNGVFLTSCRVLVGEDLVWANNDDAGGGLWVQTNETTRAALALAFFSDTFSGSAGGRAFLSGSVRCERFTGGIDHVGGSGTADIGNPTGGLAVFDLPTLFSFHDSYSSGDNKTTRQYYVNGEALNSFTDVGTGRKGYNTFVSNTPPYEKLEAVCQSLAGTSGADMILRQGGMFAYRGALSGADHLALYNAGKDM